MTLVTLTALVIETLAPEEVNTSRIMLSNFYNLIKCICRPNMMEHFGVLSSGLSTTKRLLKAEKMPLLRNYVLFPILLSPDRDPHLEVMC